MMRRIVLALIFCLICITCDAGAQTCSLTISALNFGSYNGALLTGTATGRVTCAGAWNIPLNAGTGAGATETSRKMTGPGGVTLTYQLFQDAAHSLNWGNTTSTELTGTGNATITVYGQIAAGQAIGPGTYTDTVSTATTSFTLSVVVPASCTLSAGALAFGNYAGTLLNATSTISVNCTNTAPYNVGLNSGIAAGASVSNRSMTGPSSALLGYKLFSDAGRTINWGNTVGTDTKAGTGSGSVQVLTVYGQIPAGQLVRPGSYADTVTATLTY
jgi:spore coat protein U-like protein